MKLSFFRLFDCSVRAQINLGTALISIASDFTSLSQPYVELTAQLRAALSSSPCIRKEHPRLNKAKFMCRRNLHLMAVSVKTH